MLRALVFSINSVPVVCNITPAGYHVCNFFLLYCTTNTSEGGFTTVYHFKLACVMYQVGVKLVKTMCVGKLLQISMCMCSGK